MVFMLNTNECSSTSESKPQETFSALSNISHDLFTPLNAILGFTEILLDEATGTITSKQREILENVYQSGQKMYELISALLEKLHPIV